jgi:hypothetical protein
MDTSITAPGSLQPPTELAIDLFDNWLGPIETNVRLDRCNSWKN